MISTNDYQPYAIQNIIHHQSKDDKYPEDYWVATINANYCDNGTMQSNAIISDYQYDDSDRYQTTWNKLVKKLMSLGFPKITKKDIKCNFYTRNKRDKEVSTFYDVINGKNMHIINKEIT